MKKHIMITVMLVCLTGSAFAQKSIVVAVPAGIPPLAFVGEDGQLAGYSVDYINAVAKAGNFEVVLKNTPWVGIFVGLVKGEFDAICGAVSITEKRKKVVDFTQDYFEVRQALATRKDSTVKNLSELKGQKVGGKLGAISYQALSDMDGIEPVGFDDVSLLLKGLQEGEVEAIVYDEVILHYLLEKEYKDSLKISAILENEIKDLLGIAVKKDKGELLNMLNRGMSAIKGSVVEEEIHQKWLGGRSK